MEFLDCSELLARRRRRLANALVAGGVGVLVAAVSLWLAPGAPPAGPAGLSPVVAPRAGTAARARPDAKDVALAPSVAAVAAPESAGSAPAASRARSPSAGKPTVAASRAKAPARGLAGALTAEASLHGSGPSTPTTPDSAASVVPAAAPRPVAEALTHVAPATPTAAGRPLVGAPTDATPPAPPPSPALATDAGVDRRPLDGAPTDGREIAPPASPATAPAACGGVLDVVHPLEEGLVDIRVDDRRVALTRITPAPEPGSRSATVTFVVAPGVHTVHVHVLSIERRVDSEVVGGAVGARGSADATAGAEAERRRLEPPVGRRIGPGSGALNQSPAGGGAGGHGTAPKLEFFGRLRRADVESPPPGQRA